MQTLENTTEDDLYVNGIHYSVGLSAFLQSMMVTKNITESIQKTGTRYFVVLICNPRTYNLPLSKDSFHHLHSVTKVKIE